MAAKRLPKDEIEDGESSPKEPGEYLPPIETFVKTLSARFSKELDQE